MGNNMGCGWEIGCGRVCEKHNDSGTKQAMAVSLLGNEHIDTVPIC